MDRISMAQPIAPDYRQQFLFPPRWKIGCPPIIPCASWASSSIILTCPLWVSPCPARPRAASLMPQACFSKSGCTVTSIASAQPFQVVVVAQVIIYCCNAFKNVETVDLVSRTLYLVSDHWRNCRLRVEIRQKDTATFSLLSIAFRYRLYNRCFASRHLERVFSRLGNPPALPEGFPID